MMSTHGMFTWFSFILLICWIIIIGLIVLLIVRLTGNKPSHSNDSSRSHRLVDSEQLLREFLRSQQELADEMKEVNDRLKRI